MNTFISFFRLLFVKIISKNVSENVGVKTQIKGLIFVILEQLLVPFNLGCEYIKSIILRLSQFDDIFHRKPNIFDNMVSILEKHASNLEKQVAERTRLLTEEKKKTDALLYSMLPRYVQT